MPIKIPNSLPATVTLEEENIFFMTEERALHQDIRPLRILILNLMPTKIETETQLLRLLSNTPLQVEIELMQMASHTSKNTSPEHLLKFYSVFDDLCDQRFDGMIVTGAPVELLPYDEVHYWNELQKILKWAETHVYSVFHICWAALAGLQYHYGINKVALPEKLSGVYEHRLNSLLHPVVRGFDDFFYAPHSRYCGIDEHQIEKSNALDVLAYSEQAGPYMIADRSCRNLFVLGHPEYSRMTLAKEYERDIARNLNPAIPVNYFKDNLPENGPTFKWKSHANLLFANWLNHIVYQHTPYDLSTL
ncbi:MAG: homoserine O-succinyltransferase [Clostridia bacterium]|nr:homoserine O-succinyltransferase [Clostridia bacterium]